MNFIKLFFLTLLSVQAAENITLKRVYSNDVKTFDKVTNKKELLIFVATDCTVCHRQLKNLGCLNKNLDKSFISLRGSEKELHRDFRKKVKKLYVGDNKVPAFFGLKDLSTPQVIVRKGATVKKMKGYVECIKLKDIIDKL